MKFELYTVEKKLRFLLETLTDVEREREREREREIRQSIYIYHREKVECSPCSSLVRAGTF